MVTFIYEHFDEEISVTDIAKAAFVSERKCFRLFKTLINTTPLTYYHSFNGHIGTHFDVENGVFPIDYCRRNDWIFDVSSIPLAQEITSNDIPFEGATRHVHSFFSGYIEQCRLREQNVFC